MIRQVRGKILFLLLVLLSAVILSMALTFDHLLKTVFTSEHMTDLQKHAVSFSQIIGPGFKPKYALELEHGQSVVIVDGHGQIRYREGDNPTDAQTFSLPGEEQVLQGHEIVVKTSTAPFKEAVFVAGVPVTSPGKGAIFLIEPAISGDTVIQSTNRVVLLSIAGAVLLALGTALILIERMMRPLLKMEEVAKHLMQGDYTKKIQAKSKNELGSLGNALNQLSDHLRNQKETRAEFLSNVSHEIRTPLTYIAGYIQILDEDLVNSEEERKQYIGIVHEELKRLKKLLDDLLDLAKFEETNFKLEPEAVDLALLIQDVFVTLEPHGSQKHLSIRYDGASNLPIIVADAQRIEQVLINLIYNAIQYIEEYGQIIIRSRYSDTQIFIDIEDNGPGIPEEELSHIWERFHRGDKSRNRKLGGSGLGLSIVRQIIEAHKGQIHIVSEMGKGTIVSFMLPREFGNHS
ncbi:HAMP domain-containing histidine kinase [Fodinisporobacter ferrooxydans]|uniref:histidine kinase n=1 Tax=Fodinisporobacter ferrooxydans TaxID=2901836 RepID=A0ABY4CQ08_9BACL|nr:HAMP domain-containing histidine kinase [Alicyclobacillaceae bacterium MYW30-H2]